MAGEEHYLVGDLTIDCGRGRVTRGVEEVALPKLSYDLFLALTRAAPNLLSIDSLINAVWPGIVISPETVSQRVKLLRDALGDDPKAPRYIAGRRGRGYQIVAPVEVLTHERQSGVQLPAGPRPISRRAMTLVAVALAVVIAASAVTIHFFPGGRRQANVAAESSPFNPPARSVAVLSFANLSGDPRQDYVCDGLTEELINALTRIPELRIVARTSSSSLKGAAMDVPAIARRLNVATVLEGSVREDGQRIRITAQLIDALTGFHLWSQNYDREMQDLLGLQSEIATEVAATLKVALLPDTRQKLTLGTTTNPMAFDSYLRGRYGESIQDESSLRAALAALDEAVRLDPGYADALAFRGDVLAQLANIYEKDPGQRVSFNREARSSAEKAVSMAPDSALVHQVLARVLAATTAEYARIDAERRRSIELQPNDPAMLVGYASYAAQFGRPDALAAAQKAVRLNPMRLGTYANLGVVLFYLHRHGEARTAFLEASRLGTNRLTTNWTGMNELADGKPSAALRYCRDPDFSYDQLCLAIAYQALGRDRDAAAMLQKIQNEQGDDGAYEYAEIYASWGQAQQALRWLAKAVERKDTGLLAIRTDPFLNSLRNLAPFKTIVTKLQLPS